MSKLQDRRVAAGLTQTQLAYKADISSVTLVKYENGERQIDGAKIRTLALIARALNCRIEDIIEDEETISLLKVKT